jgi:ribosomal protein S24E
MSDDLIKQWDTQVELARTAVETAFQVADDMADRIEQLERELVVAIEVVAESGRKRGEAEAKLAKAVEALRNIAEAYGIKWHAGVLSRAALAELEGEK